MSDREFMEKIDAVADMIWKAGALWFLRGGG